MKKIFNYTITYKMETTNGYEQKEEVYFTKPDMLVRYLNILFGETKIFPTSGEGSISSLKVYVNYVNCGTEELTGKLNKFISN